MKDIRLDQRISLKYMYNAGLLIFQLANTKNEQLLTCRLPSQQIQGDGAKLVKAKTLLTCTWVALGSNLCHDANYFVGFRNFPQLLQSISKQYLALGQNSPLPDPFQFNIDSHPTIRRCTTTVFVTFSVVK